jgi:hypothetical protein
VSPSSSGQKNPLTKNQLEQVAAATASIFRFRIEISRKHRPACHPLLIVYCLNNYSIVKMEAVRSRETKGNLYQVIRQITDNSALQILANSLFI